MEIHVLKATVTEKDLSELVRRKVPKDLPVEDLQVRLGPEGVYLEGMYPLFVNVTFETLWELSVQTGLVRARLAKFKALGIPANIFKSAIMKLLEDAVRQEKSMSLAGDVVLLDLDHLLGRQGVTGRTNLRGITCLLGELVIEAGVPNG